MSQSKSPAVLQDNFKEINLAITSFKKGATSSNGTGSRGSEEASKHIEECILEMAKRLEQEKNVASLQALLVAVRPFCELVPRAKAGRIVRALVEHCLAIDQGKDEKVAIVSECVEWATANRQEYLRRTLQARLTCLYNDLKEPMEAQKTAAILMPELKKLEDKELLIEVAIEESKASFALKNYAKAKAALLIAKTNANAAYVQINLQSALDMQSGILAIYCDKDFRTGFSYFFEALENYRQAGDHREAIRSIKYMCLCKILMDGAASVPLLLASKEAHTYSGPPIEAMRVLAKAFEERSLNMYNVVIAAQTKELIEDPVIDRQQLVLKDKMIQKEITRIIEPYSEVELSYISRKVELPRDLVEKTISTMILDMTIRGCIDQQAETVIIYGYAEPIGVYKQADQLISILNATVDGLYTYSASAPKAMKKEEKSAEKLLKTKKNTGMEKSRSKSHSK